MSFSRFKVVSFGGSKTSLATVGYQLLNADGTANGSRITSGVTERAGGAYGATVSFPDDFAGELRWDTGEVTPAYASEDINSDEDLGTLATEIAAIRAQTDTINAETASAQSDSSGTTALTVVQASDVTLQLTARRSDRSIVDCSSATEITFGVFAKPISQDSTALITKKLSLAEISMTSGGGDGRIDVALDDQDTVGLNASETAYGYQLRVLVGGAERVAESGDFTLEAAADLAGL